MGNVSVSEIPFSTRPLLYVAGPYTHADPVENTHRVVKVATVVYERTQWVPVVPHLTLLWHLVDPQPVEHWYAYDIHLLSRCDAVVRLPGPSTGADRELEAAAELHIEVVPYDSLPALARAHWEEGRAVRATMLGNTARDSYVPEPLPDEAYAEHDRGARHA